MSNVTNGRFLAYLTFGAIVIFTIVFFEKEYKKKEKAVDPGIIKNIPVDTFKIPELKFPEVHVDVEGYEKAKKREEQYQRDLVKRIEYMNLSYDFALAYWEMKYNYCERGDSAYLQMMQDYLDSSAYYDLKLRKLNAKWRQ